MAGKKLNGEERRQTIIQAATVTIAQTDFAQCTTAKIAKQAGVAEAMIYSHFKSKKELQLTVLDTIREEFLAMIAVIDRIPSFSLTAFREFGKVFHEKVQKNPQQVTVVLKALALEDPDFKEKVWEIIVSLQQALEGVLGKVLDHNKRTSLEPHLPYLAWLNFAWIASLSGINQLGKLDQLPEEHLDRFIAFMEYILVLSPLGEESDSRSQVAI